MYVPPMFQVEEDAAWQIVLDAGAGMLVINTDDGLASVFVPVIPSEARLRDESRDPRICLHVLLIRSSVLIRVKPFAYRCKLGKTFP